MHDNQNKPPLLAIRNLKLDFGMGAGTVRAVDDVSLTIREGETLCLVGESGCGKSVTALSIARLVPSPPAHYSGGEILLNGEDVLRTPNRELRRIRGGIVSYVFQEPGASLNPVFPIGSQIKESIQLHRPQVATDEEVVRLLKLVGMAAPEARLRDYPHQLSGGMQQRVMIAMALASEPKLLVADEPTAALDVTIQAQIIDLLRDLRQRLGMSMLLITHNLGIVGDIADHVAVMYAGQIVELAPALTLLTHPMHPYTQALMNSVPKLGSRAGFQPVPPGVSPAKMPAVEEGMSDFVQSAIPRRRLSAIPGNVPELGAMPSGCRFHPRCPKARADCRGKLPELVEVEPQRWVRCPYWAAPVPAA